MCRTFTKLTKTLNYKENTSKFILLLKSRCIHSPLIDAAPPPLFSFLSFSWRKNTVNLEPCRWCSPNVSIRREQRAPSVTNAASSLVNSQWRGAAESTRRALVNVWSCRQTEWRKKQLQDSKEGKQHVFLKQNLGILNGECMRVLILSEETGDYFYIQRGLYILEVT